MKPLLLDGSVNHLEAVSEHGHGNLLSIHSRGVNVNHFLPKPQ